MLLTSSQPKEAPILRLKPFTWVVSTNYTITTVKNGIFPSNTYFLSDNETKQSIVIDPGLDLDAIKLAEAAVNLNPIAILATHGHFDHIGNVAYFQEKYKIPFYIHKHEEKILKSANFLLKIAKIPLHIKTPKADVLWESEMNILNLQSFNLKIDRFPGHTPGSCVIQQNDFLFSGDIVYRQGLGFNHFPGEDKEVLKSSILHIFEKYNGDSLIFPGHGASASLQEIKQHNKELGAFLQ